MVDEVEEFVALWASVLDGGEITEEGAYQLGDWLNHHEETAEHWPCNQLIEPLQAVWADGTANPEELLRLARVLIGLQEEWALRKGAMATYYKSLGPAAVYSYVPKVPTIGVPLAPAASSPRERPRRASLASAPSTPSSERRSRWVLAAGSITVLLIGAGLFAAREMKSAHPKPVVVSSPPVVSPSPVPVASPSLAPPRIAAVRASAKPATPSSSGWTVVTRQNVAAKAGKKEILIPKGTTLKVIGRSDRDYMINYKGEDLTIPASATTSSR